MNAPQVQRFDGLTPDQRDAVLRVISHNAPHLHHPPSLAGHSTASSTIANTRKSRRKLHESGESGDVQLDEANEAMGEKGRDREGSCGFLVAPYALRAERVEGEKIGGWRDVERGEMRPGLYSYNMTSACFSLMFNI